MPRIRVNPSRPTELQLLDEGGRYLAIHPLWLRERCRGEASIDRRTEQRLYNPSDLDPDLSIARVVEDGTECWRVTFSDGEQSSFSASDILAEVVSGNDGCPARQGWGSDLAPLPRARWRERLDESVLLGMVDMFLRYGFIILQAVPTAPGTVLEVARTFGFPRDTNFGTVFDVRSEPSGEDLAYTALALDPHTDNPYRAPVPGIQLLHCLTNQTSGGLSTLVDGLSVAEVLRAEDPDAFRALTRTPVRFRYVDGVTTEHVDWSPLIELDATGRMQAIRFSPRLDFVPLLPPDELSGFYRARRLLDRMLKSAEFEVRFRLDDGDLVMFDNRRLLHGRTRFDPGEGPRHLQGCYIDIDGPRSLYRVLRRKLALGRVAE
ncbi:TauD/TfdA family dioxygenase [Rhodospirillaceae bacterium SYSU D60014]|uniref:TauD/TfdA family dioxygenase n=1 Tax=Virgifigura deserti TaxID=2268457 RepID=UPI0013C4B271